MSTQTGKMDKPIFVWEFEDVGRMLLAMAIIIPFFYWTMTMVFKYCSTNSSDYGAVVPMMIIFLCVLAIFMVVTQVSNPRAREHNIRMEEYRDWVATLEKVKAQERMETTQRQEEKAKHILAQNERWRGFEKRKGKRKINFKDT